MRYLVAPRGHTQWVRNLRVATRGPPAARPPRGALRCGQSSPRRREGRDPARVPEDAGSGRSARSSRASGRTRTTPTSAASRRPPLRIADGLAHRRARRCGGVRRPRLAAGARAVGGGACKISCRPSPARRRCRAESGPFVGARAVSRFRPAPASYLPEHMFPRLTTRRDRPRPLRELVRGAMGTALEFATLGEATLGSARPPPRRPSRRPPAVSRRPPPPPPPTRTEGCSLVSPAGAGPVRSGPAHRPAARRFIARHPTGLRPAAPGLGGRERRRPGAPPRSAGLHRLSGRPARRGRPECAGTPTPRADIAALPVGRRARDRATPRAPPNANEPPDGAARLQ